MKRWAYVAFGSDLTDDLRAALSFWTYTIPDGYEPASDPELRVTPVEDHAGSGIYATRIEGWIK